MKKLLLSLLILVLAAGAVFLVLRIGGDTQQVSSESALYPYYAKEQGKDLLFVLETGGLENAFWKASEGDSWTIEDKSREDSGRFLIHSDSTLPFVVTFSLFQEGRDISIYELDASFVLDADEKLSFVSAVQNGYTELASGGEDTSLPYSIRSDVDGAILVCFLSEDHDQEWSVENASSLTIIGPEVQEEGICFYLSGEAEGETQVSISSNAAGQKLALTLQYDGSLSVVSHEFTTFTPIAENDSLEENRKSFETEYGVVQIPEGYHAVSYEQKTFYGKNDTEDSFPIGRVTFQQDDTDHGERFDLSIAEGSHTESFLGGLDSADGTSTIQARGSISITVYTADDFYAAVWESEGLSYRLDYDHAAAVSPDVLADMAVFITQGR